MQCAKCGHVRFEAGKISNLVTLQIRYCRSEPLVHWHDEDRG